MTDPDAQDLPVSTGPSALPSRTARILAFFAILVAGTCGGLIGYAIVKTSCHGSCATPEGLGALTGAVIAAAAVLMPAIYARGAHPTEFRIEAVSVGVAVVLLVMYAASLVFSLITHAESAAVEGEQEQATMSVRGALGLLAFSGALVAVESELLTGALEPTVQSLGLSRLWVGLILIPIVSNAAEHWSAVRAATHRKADLTVAIAVGSSTQVALVVTPLLVFAGLAFGHHLHLDFTAFDISAIALSVVVVAFVTYDGVTNWLEGAQLMAVYAILAISSFYLVAT